MTDTNSPDPTELHKQNWKQAERAHDSEDKHYEVHARQVEAFAILGIRTLTLTAAGGIVAALGFYSANYERLALDPSRVLTLNGILLKLFISLVLAIICILFAYFSQVFFAATIDERKRTYDFPYVVGTPESSRAGGIGQASRVMSILLALVSGGFIIAAGMEFGGLVKV